MSLVLGIDTGGTYTDGVVIDREAKRVLAKAKALTTRDDLSHGIIQCIDNLRFPDCDKVGTVTLSTTLATNAIVEGKGCEVGLLMIGFNPSTRLPAREVKVIPGGHTVQGNEKEPFDDELAREAIESFRGLVDAMAVSAYLSVRNPEHESRARRMIEEILDVPVVCAHQLTRSLGIHERTVTAVLNARLMPIIRELLQSVKKALSERGIRGAVMIVRSDGTLVGEEQAMRKPIETLLSGPAASIIGATFLAGEKDALVLDMGGTTTDIAILMDGVPRVSEDGAKVGGWRTHVRAAAINTFGLGGDSWIQLDMARHFQVGPQRVVPICVAARQFPNLIEELKAKEIPQAHLLLHAQVTDCFFLLNENVTAKLNDKERQVAVTVRDTPHSYLYIAEATETEINLLNLDRLVSTGVLGRISVTPTDILHAAGELTMWDAEAARIAVTMLARRFGMDMGEFIEFATGKITDELCYTCLQSFAEHDGAGFDMKTDAAARYFLDKCIRPQANDIMRYSMIPRVPVIGVGAPVGSWLPKMAERLGARLVIPSGSEVANAIGSATGRVMESVKILIHPGKMGVGFNMHSTWEHKSFETLEEAAEYALKQAEAGARDAARANGVDEPEVTICRDDRYAEASAGDRIYIESRIEAIATEHPEWERKSGKDNFFVDTRDRGMTL